MRTVEEIISKFVGWAIVLSNNVSEKSAVSSRSTNFMKRDGTALIRMGKVRSAELIEASMGRF